MASERFIQQRENFRSTLSRLREALEQNETEFVRDSIIQRFEFTFEMAWKSMFRYLTDKGEKIAEKAWAVLPSAFEAMLIEDAEGWEKMREYRNDTSHEYLEEKAIEVAAFVRGDGIRLFNALLEKLSRE